MREVLREMYSEESEEIVEKLTGCKVLSSHSDISTKMGERIEVYVLDKDLEKCWADSSTEYLCIEKAAPPAYWRSLFPINR